ncbi:hypothetical protein M1O53_04425, partial [Dehalococcoidia bacterium]|nr:hypothetical protein [Dehalococcoidia bacterium]
MRQMIRIYRRAFRLHHKKYLPKALGWFLIAVLQAPVYVLMVLRFDDLFNGIEPVRNGLIVIGLATMGYVLRLIADLNLFQTAMVSPTCDLQVG